MHINIKPYKTEIEELKSINSDLLTACKEAKKIISIWEDNYEKVKLMLKQAIDKAEGK